jgi:hypothetical protein
MNKLTEEKEKAIRMDVFTNWIETYRKKHKKNPTIEHIRAYVEELNTRYVGANAPKNAVELIDLQREEEKIRRYAKKIMFNEMIPEERVKIYLMPALNGKTLVKGGHPSIIQLGFTSAEKDFKMDLRRLIRRAHKVWEPAAIILSSKLYEYNKKNRKFISFKDNPDYYPLIPEDRIRVEVIELVRVIDMKTGESKMRSRQTEVGHYRHLKNNPLVEEARLDLSRMLYANGKLTDDDVTYEKEESTEPEKTIESSPESGHV